MLLQLASIFRATQKTKKKIYELFESASLVLCERDRLPRSDLTI